MGDSSSQATSIYTMAAVSQIGDGQIQGGMHTVTMTPGSQINDGQIQNPTGTAAVTSSAPPADPGCSATPMPAVQRASVSASMDTSMTATSPESDSSSPSTSVSVSSQTSAPTPSVAVSASMTSLVSCLTNSTLQLTLSNGTLLDAHNRTGYVASNYQFQFDGPPQAGAIYTAGWSVCSGGDEEGGEQPMLALGGITTFYQCLSGRFYNLYTVNWAAQCSPVQLKITGLVQC